MNQKAAKLARRINRAKSLLVKKSSLPVDDRGVVQSRDDKGRSLHKLPRKVKRHWDGMGHRQRGDVARYWREALP